MDFRKHIKKIRTKDNILRKDFLAQIVKHAKSLNKTIIYTEPEDDRILYAADEVLKKKIAKIILVGDSEKTRARIKELGLKCKDVMIIDINHVPMDFAEYLYELRKDKGMTLEEAKKLLKEPIWFSTMMLKKGMVDGVVSGVIHPTAHTFRPALQIIKTKPGIKTASSYFILSLKQKEFFFADCALNIDPDAEQLSDIAISTNDSAAMFGLNPKVAMLSFSTKGSGEHPMIAKIIKAVDLVKQKRKDIIIDGEFQLDAAIVPEVAKLKAPNSPIQGNANVLIFPDLNSANIGYKMAERFNGDALAIGPIAQGLDKPVNDLSRGATVKEIVLVTAVTAIQAETGRD